MKEWIELLTRSEIFLFLAVAPFLWFLFYGMELDGFLHLLKSAVEVSSGLRLLGVIVGLGRVGEHNPGVIVFIVLFLELQLLVEGGLTVEIDVLTGGEGLPVAAHCSVLLGAACSNEQNENQRRRKP